MTTHRDISSKWLIDTNPMHKSDPCIVEARYNDSFMQDIVRAVEAGKSTRFIGPFNSKEEAERACNDQHALQYEWAKGWVAKSGTMPLGT